MDVWMCIYPAACLYLLNLPLFHSSLPSFILYFYPFFSFNPFSFYGLCFYCIFLPRFHPYFIALFAFSVLFFLFSVSFFYFIPNHFFSYSFLIILQPQHFSVSLLSFLSSIPNNPPLSLSLSPAPYSHKVSDFRSSYGLWSMAFPSPT